MKKLILVPVIAILAFSIGANSLLLMQQNSKLKEINTGIRSLDTQSSSIRGDLSELQVNVSNLQAGYSSLQSGVSTLQGNVSYLQGSYAGLQGNYGNLQNNYASLQGNFATLQGNLTVLQGTYTSLQGTYTTLQTNVADLQKTYTGLQASFSNVQGNVSGLQGRLTDLQGQISTIQAAANDTFSQTDLVNLVNPLVVRVEVNTGSSRGTGTGFILSNNGYIMTANHVVENVTAASITLSNGERFGSTVVGRDVKRDLAIVKMNTSRTDFPPAPLGSSANTSVGETVMASGFALALGGTTSYSMGIVSAFRIVDGLNYIQIDSPINPGNSGGPLFNYHGQVIGVNVGKMVGLNVEGIGLAVPIDECKALIQSTVK